MVPNIDKNNLAPSSFQEKEVTSEPIGSRTQIKSTQPVVLSEQSKQKRDLEYRYKLFSERRVGIGDHLTTSSNKKKIEALENKKQGLESAKRTITMQIDQAQTKEDELRKRRENAENQEEKESVESELSDTQDKKLELENKKSQIGNEENETNSEINKLKAEEKRKKAEEDARQAQIHSMRMDKIISSNPAMQEEIKRQKMLKSLQDKAQRFSNNLKDVKKAKKPLGKIKAATKVVKGIVNALKKINFSKDWPYVLAFFVAVGKDIVDASVVGALPGIGTVITLCASIFIFFMILYAGAGGKGKMDKKIARRFGALLAGTISEMFFGLNFVPIESMTVVFIYAMALMEKANESEG